MLLLWFSIILHYLSSSRILYSCTRSSVLWFIVYHNCPKLHMTKRTHVPGCANAILKNLNHLPCRQDDIVRGECAVEQPHWSAEAKPIHRGGISTLIKAIKVLNNLFQNPFCYFVTTGDSGWQASKEDWHLKKFIPSKMALWDQVK